MKALFVCNQNKHRSVTAQEMFASQFETKSAGLYNGTPLTIQLLEWADIVFVMDDEQRREIGQRFPKQYIKKQIVSLNIPDTFAYNQPELKLLLKESMGHQIPLL